MDEALQGVGCGLCPGSDCAHAPVWLSTYLYCRPPYPAQLKTGSLWSASVGLKER